ncbi:MAG: hypothetical protein JW755_06875 [Candidatus Aminicenantes bacterium]|nr:hypothetical protein [Candidatus Aminicenantes bacterium]
MNKDHYQSRELGIGWLIGLSAAGLLILFLVFSNFGVTLWAFIKFLFGLVLLVYFPGKMLVDLAGLKLLRLETASLSLVLGMVTTTAVNKFSRWFSLEVIFFIWILSALVFFIGKLIKNPPKKKNLYFHITPSGIGVVLILILVFAVLIADNYRNVIPGNDGSITVNLHYYDGFYRNAISRELSHTVPPMVPAVGDLPLSYHHGMDLFVSLFYRYFDIDVFDLNHRFVITFFFVLLVFIFFIFIRELTASEKASLLGTFLIVFGSGGFAYLASWLLGVQQWGNVFFTFYFFNITNINSFLPALSILFAGFYCLFKYIKQQKKAWMIFSSLLLALSLEFKTFFIGPVIGALFLAGIIYFLSARKWSILQVGAGTAAVSLPLLYAANSHNVGGLSYVFKFRFVDWIIFSLQELDLNYLYLTWKGVIQHARISIVNIALLIPCFLIFFVGSFGLGVWALPSGLKEYFSFKKIKPERLFLTTFAGGSLMYFFFIQLSLGGRPRNYVHIYAFFLTFIILMIYFSEKVIRFTAGKKKMVKTTVLVAVMAFSVPNTIQFLYVKVCDPQPRIFPPPFLEAADWINQNTQPDAMILHPIVLRYVCYFADRRVVMDSSVHSYLTFHLTTRQIEKRTADIHRFFEDPELNGNILETYGVTHVLAGNPPSFLLEGTSLQSEIICYRDIGTREIKKYRRSHNLKPLFANNDYMIYAVEKLPEEERNIFILEEIEGKKRLQPFKKK